MAKKLPCDELHCELLERLRLGVNPRDLTITTEQMEEYGAEIVKLLADRNLPLDDALVVLEFVKSSIWAEKAVLN